MEKGGAWPTATDQDPPPARLNDGLKKAVADRGNFSRPTTTARQKDEGPVSRAMQYSSPDDKPPDRRYGNNAEKRPSDPAMEALRDLWVDATLPTYVDACENLPVLHEEVVETESNTAEDTRELPTPIPSLQAGMMFTSYKEFQELFQPWNETLDHRFRIRSSHPFWNPDGTKDARFQYRQLTYHCAHYGEPRSREQKSRSRRNGYMASGCEAKLHLTFNRRHKTLVVTKMNDTHRNHERSPWTQEDNTEPSLTGHGTDFDFNEHQLQQLFDLDDAQTIDDWQGDEDVANLSGGQPDDITSEP